MNEVECLYEGKFRHTYETMLIHRHLLRHFLKRRILVNLAFNLQSKLNETNAQSEEHTTLKEQLAETERTLFEIEADASKALMLDARIKDKDEKTKTGNLIRSHRGRGGGVAGGAAAFLDAFKFQYRNLYR